MVIKLSNGKELVLNKEQEKAYKAILKLQYKRTHGRGRYDRLTHSIMKRERFRAEESGEYWLEYRLFNGANLSDEEVEERVDEMRYRVYSMYDCTGKPTTCWIHWHRNPTGLISVVQCVGLDI